MRRKSLKLSGMMLSSVIVIVSFVYAVNIQPAVIGDTDDFSSFFGIPLITDDSNGVTLYHNLNNFKFYSNFTDFLRSDSRVNLRSGWSSSMMWGSAPRSVFAEENLMSSAASIDMDGGDLIDYSQTNVQVTGVDEPDIVKTDGKYLYIVSGNKVIIVKATPAEDAEIECEVSVNDSLTIKNIFVSGSRLVIFAEDYNYPIYRTYVALEAELNETSVEIVPPPRWYRSPDTHIKVFELEDMQSPELVKDVVVPGHFSGARLIEDFVYLITNQYSYDLVYLDDNQTIVPAIMINKELQEISLSDIFYVNTSEESQSLTNIVSINIHDDEEEVTAKIFLLGNSQILYVSRDNIYITYSTRSYDYDMLREIVEEVLTPILPESIKAEIELVNALSITEYQKKTVTEWILQNYTNSMDKELKENISKEIISRIDRTIIHRISIKDGEIQYEAQGTVPGGASNQFSMNEHNGYLRISTTMEGWRISNFISNVETQNNIYVLNMDLEVVGSVEGLAPRERIYATRFLGDKCYLVTFRQIDPFFVIDLSDPTNPTVLGELKIPGFSTYLHPYDETHIIGIGRNGTKIKVSLYDVSNVSSPVELSKLEIENNDNNWWRAQSIALDEHKAFLFDKEKNLLVIPIGSYYKQSAYVFDISVQNGIQLKGNVTHDLQTNEDENNDEIYYYRYDNSNSIKRALYIEDVLYTISNNLVKMNSLDDLSEINSVELV